jgi:hypothetical protein
MRGFLLIFITMKQNLNEEVARMREMMGLEEQLLKGLGDKLKTTWNDKVKPAAEKAGQAIQKGVNNVAQKVADATQQQQSDTTINNQQGQQPKPTSSKQDVSSEEPLDDNKENFDALVELSKKDVSNKNIGYGIGKHVHSDMSWNMASTKAMGNLAYKNATENTTVNPDGSKQTIRTNNPQDKRTMRIAQYVKYASKENGQIIYNTICVAKYN